MSALVDRITEVVAAYPKADEHHCGSPDCVGSARYHWWAAHVAERVTALFTEECGYQIEGDQPDEPDAWFPAADYRTSRPVTHRRWVSSWITEQEQP